MTCQQNVEMNVYYDVYGRNTEFEKSKENDLDI